MMNFLKDFRTTLEHNEPGLTTVSPPTGILQDLLLQGLHEDVEVAAIISNDSRG